jgi:hypothetical protein
MKLPWLKHPKRSEAYLQEWIITARLAGVAIGLACMVAIMLVRRYR